VTAWSAAVTPFLKALHIVALTAWCGGLLALPLMLSRHHPANPPAVFGNIQRAAHLTYTMVVTPAAVIAVVAGTWLILTREALVPWLFAKLLFVAILVAGHAWIGHILVTVVESGQRRRPPPSWLPVAVVLTPMLAILALVLGKPDLSDIDFPGWLSAPQDRELLFDVPSR